ncbi:putative uncharacterized transposon-derived protein F52C9.6 [Varanus komodoensis]|nr:putative uncharacterized transposon-derived protein F52C9.6 [Varanus komodoensis]
MRKVGLDESQVGIKITGRNINNLRYTDDTTLMAESEEELKSLLMRVKEESAKVGLKLNIKKTKIMAASPLTSWQIDGEGYINDSYTHLPIVVYRCLSSFLLSSFSLPIFLFLKGLSHLMMGEQGRSKGRDPFLLKTNGYDY